MGAVHIKIITNTQSDIYQHLREIVETFNTIDCSTNCFAVYCTKHVGHLSRGGGGGGGGERGQEGGREGGMSERVTQFTPQTAR